MQAAPIPTPVLNPESLSATNQAARLSYYLRTLFEFGEQLYSWELFVEAADLFLYLASRLPQYTWPWFWLARCHEELGDPMCAARFYELAGHVGDGQTFALLAARAWTKAGQPEQARAVLCREGLWHS